MAAVSPPIPPPTIVKDVMSTPNAVLYLKRGTAAPGRFRPGRISRSPDLVVVGGHVGYPWIDEVMSLATKYPNFYIDTSAYAVHRLPAQLLDYMRGRGRTRVMFGTNWPMLSAGRCLRQLSGMDFDRETSELFLGENAARVFKLTGDIDTHRNPMRSASVL
jgi:hypothetical protein